MHDKSAKYGQNCSLSIFMHFSPFQEAGREECNAIRTVPSVKHKPQKTLEKEVPAPSKLTREMNWVRKLRTWMGETEPRMHMYSWVRNHVAALLEAVVNPAKECPRARKDERSPPPAPQPLRHHATPPHHARFHFGVGQGQGRRGSSSSAVLRAFVPSP